MSDELTVEQKARMDRRFNLKIREFYFSPKKRAAEKQRFIVTLREMKEIWPRFSEMTPDYRDMVITITSFCSYMLTHIADAEVWSRGRVLRNKRFTLWKYMFRNEYLVLFSFFKVSEDINKEGSIIFPEDLPKADKPVKAYFYRHAFTTKGYREVARGTFYQKYMEITKVAYTLKGADRTIRFYLDDTKLKSPEVTAYALP